MNSIDGYFETPWVEIDIETIVTQLAEFDLRYVFCDILYIQCLGYPRLTIEIDERIIITILTFSKIITIIVSLFLMIIVVLC